VTDKYILAGTMPVLEPDLLTWARWFETAERQVAETWVTPLDGAPGQASVRVSTVFLGLDHQWGDGPPLLFETMCFTEKKCWNMDRCSTWDEAKAMHQRMVENVRLNMLEDSP
jgi:hypothetical protein